MFRQRTLKAAVRASGVGLHSGLRVELTILPAPADSGIVFRRIDLPGSPDIKVDPRHITDTRMATTLSAGLSEALKNTKVATIEHLMSAFYGVGVDNAVVTVTASEIPILDGSSGSFVFLLRQNGLVEQSALKKFVSILQKVEVIFKLKYY